MTLVCQAVQAGDMVDCDGILLPAAAAKVLAAA
jgi:hypothetical protein